MAVYERDGSHPLGEGSLLGALGKPPAYRAKAVERAPEPVEGALDRSPVALHLHSRTDAMPNSMPATTVDATVSRATVTSARLVAHLLLSRMMRPPLAQWVVRIQGRIHTG